MQEAKISQSAMFDLDDGEARDGAPALPYQGAVWTWLDRSAEDAATHTDNDRNAGLMSVSELHCRAGISVSRLYQLEKAGKGPPKIRLNQRCVGYPRAEAFAWISSRRAALEAPRRKRQS
jgi:predicted DNA-binding transcriptional regulator AlpA